ncbi:hypothetical protein [Microbacterium oleivorans]|uniref:hypothetical protein n=1 Tax=Microbacterium oleivorans TaxID=273677 RepID=UPI00203B3882|nr:hypothetical protein [Microbacterium oleivorans]MCM3695249.1 hypothetical protein [Microbacterium oleivorans]
MGKTPWRRPLVLWIAVMGLIALGMLGIVVGSAVMSAILVDGLPGGGWTPEGTTPAVDAAHAALVRSSLGFVVVVVVGVAVPLLVTLRRRRARMQQIRPDTPA